MLPEWVALQAVAVDKVWVPRNGPPQGSFGLKLLFNIVEGSLSHALCPLRVLKERTHKGRGALQGP